MPHAVRQSLRVVLIAGLAGGALAACGGSSSPKADSAGTTTSSGASSSSTAPAPVTGPATDPTYAKAALQLADVGTEFAGYRKAGGVKPIGAKSCSVTALGAFLTTRDNAYSGPMFKKKDSTYFAYSETYVFRDEADAKRFAAFRATPAFKQCKQKQDDAATSAANANTYVKLTPVTWSDPTGRVPSMYRELTGNSAGGKQVDSGFYDRYTVRDGRVVVVINIDSNLERTTAESQALANQTGDILRSFDDGLATRVPRAGA